LFFAFPPSFNDVEIFFLLLFLITLFFCVFHTTAYLGWLAAAGRSLLMRVIFYVEIPESIITYLFSSFFFFLFYHEVTGGAISSSPSRVRREKNGGGGGRSRGG
jgi:hypothetical protein